MRHAGDVQPHPHRPLGASDASPSGSPMSAWTTPDQPMVSSTAAPARHVATAPLGGVAPLPAVPVVESHRRPLIVAAALLVASVLCAVSSLMSWHDYGRGLDPIESGWDMADGSTGRGWVAIVVAIVLATSGVLLVNGRIRAGRIWARVGAAALVVLSVLEWAFGARATRSGPGLGLWVMLVVGVLLLVLVGALLPTGSESGGGDARSKEAPPPRSGSVG